MIHLEPRILMHKWDGGTFLRHPIYKIYGNRFLPELFFANCLDKSHAINIIQTSKLRPRRIITWVVLRMIQFTIEAAFYYDRTYTVCHAHYIDLKPLIMNQFLEHIKIKLTISIRSLRSSASQFEAFSMNADGETLIKFRIIPQNVDIFWALDSCAI